MQNLLEKKSRGFTFIELLVTIAVMAVVFGGLIGAIQFTLKLISITKISTSALSLANERIEYIRSLDYADVGTVAGIPSGLIPQNATTTLNGVVFNERVLIQYVDSPDDGTGAADVNGILADYKEVKIEYSWQSLQGTSTIFLLTNIVPPGMESTLGGGTLTVNVFDANVLPLSGAAVRIYNNSGTSTIDTIRYTNASGIAMFAGAPAAANYEITVFDTGYSTDQTYSATTSNPNPATPHVAVLESAVSTMNFQIDELSNLLVRTVGPSTDDSFSDDFSDMTNSTSSVGVEVTGGELVLSGGVGAYIPSGSTFSLPVNPGAITSWNTANWNATVPVSTTFAVQVFSVSGTTFTLIPDIDLPGNSAGFTTGPVVLSGLSVGTYPTLALGAVLTSADVSVTPTLSDWEVAYTISEPPIASVPFTLTGSKVIGTTVMATPIYKYSGSHTTNGSGEVQLSDLEWDFYSLVLDTGVYDIQQSCPNIPYSLSPGVDETLVLTLIPATAYSLRVSVVDADGDLIPNATVDISRSGFSDSDVTSICGQVFFGTGLSLAPDYQVDVDASGYVSQAITDVNIEGAEVLQVTLNEI